MIGENCRVRSCSGIGSSSASVRARASSSPRAILSFGSERSAGVAMAE